MRLALVMSAACGLAFPAGAGELAISLTTPAGQAMADAVVMVRPDSGPTPGRRLSGAFVLAQKDMRFQPFVLVVPVGSEVVFPNFDAVRHHVYSFSKAKTFELKLYGKDETRRVRFDKAGVVGVGCNIHDDMSAFIRVVDTPYAVRSAATGQAVLRDLPAGPATVIVWHPYLRAPDREIRRRITIPATGTLRLSMTGALRAPQLHHGGY